MQNWPENTGKITLKTVDSTMAEARRQAGTVAAPIWIHAATQTAGTGRRGRAWDTGAGNFSASLLLRPDAPPHLLALRSFVAALALKDALVAATGNQTAFALKWPNDVLLNGGKLAGILLETLPEGRENPALIIGIGVNLKSMPPQTALDTRSVSPKTLSQDLGIRVTPEAFLDLLAPAFNRWETTLKTYGFEPIRAAWLQSAAHLGKQITARTATTETVGIFETLDATGALVLQTSNGPQTVAAADIYFS